MATAPKHFRVKEEPRVKCQALDCRNGILVCRKKSGEEYRHLCRACNGHGDYVSITDEVLKLANRLNARLLADADAVVGFTYVPTRT